MQYVADDNIEQVIEELAPDVVTESSDFLLPEDQVNVETIPVTKALPFSDNVFDNGPLFLSTIADELSRRYIFASVAKDANDAIELDKSLPSLDEINEEYLIAENPQSILKCYSPSYSQWFSSFRKVPRDFKPFLSGEVSTDSNVLIRVNKCEVRSKPSEFFEPLFASATLYSTINEDFQRISETFHFDLTPNKLRKEYSFAYMRDESKVSAIANKGSCFSVADASGDVDPHLCMFLALIPEEIKFTTVYLVIQINKVLTTDGEKAVAPYLPRAAPPAELKKLKVSAERLSSFRQPIGIGAVKLFDENSQLAVGAPLNSTVPVYSHKVCCNDAALFQLMKEMFPTDGNKYIRLEELDIKLKMSFFNAGPPDQYIERIKDLGIIGSAGSPRIVAPRIAPKIIESQIYGPSHRFVATEDSSTKPSATPIKKLLTLFPSSMRGATEVIRQLRTSFDNTLFLQVTQFDRFLSNHRNLCTKVELVEFKGVMPSDRKVPSQALSQEVLCNIYNQQSLWGAEFVHDAFTRVSYHARNPSIADEFKIKLPEVLTPRHWLKFTALHIHVKPQAPRNSLLSNIMRSSTEKPDKELNESELLGVGYLPLMVSGECLIEDSEHTILITQRDNAKVIDVTINYGSVIQMIAGGSNDIPIIKVRTKAITAFASSAKPIQKLCRSCPLPLGTLASTSLPIERQVKILLRAEKYQPVESKLVEAIADLNNCPTLELSRHFLTISRFLVRAMLSGTGAYDEAYADPYKHFTARCQAFLVFIRIIDKVFGGYGKTGAAESALSNDVLEAFIEYYLDEDVPIDANVFEGIKMQILSMTSTSPIDNSVLPTVSPPQQVSLKRLSFLDVPTEIPSSTATPVAAAAAEPTNMAFHKRPSRSFLPSDELERDKSSGSGLKDDELESVSDDDNNNNESSSAEVSRPISIAVTVDSQRDSSQSNRYQGSNELIIMEEDDGEKVIYANTFDLEHHANLDDNNNEDDDVLATNVGFEGLDDSLIVQTSTKDEQQSVVNNENGGEEDEDIEERDHNLSFGARESIAIRSKDRHLSNDRKSWGRYITDSMWLSGRFVPLSTHAPQFEGDAAAIEASESYLTDIAHHIALQAERIIVEHLITLGIFEISSSILDEDELTAMLDPKHVLAGKRYRFSNKFHLLEKKLLPFQSERQWFDPIDNGTIVNDDDMFVNDEAREMVSMKLSSSTQTTRNTLHLVSAAPFYDSIQGFRERSHNVLRGSLDSSFVVHWWPWFYETLIFQWTATLAIILSSLNGISKNNLESMIGSYPYELELAAKPSHSEMKKDMRVLLFEHGPTLLKMILKSLMFRVKFEGLRTPVLLDDQCLSALENLVLMLALEAFNLTSGLWNARKTVKAVAHFFRSLFAILAPGQVIRFIQAFLKVARRAKGKSAEELELKLLAVEELSYFDHFVAVNFPYTLDAPIALFAFNFVEFAQPAGPQMLNAFNSSGIRYATCPIPYTLAHIVLSELAVALAPECPKRDLAWAILRDLMVRHALDARYQTKEAQKRIVCMYLPLLDEFLKSSDYLFMQRVESTDRREALSIFLYVINGTPDRVLRAKFRLLCDTINNNSSSTPRTNDSGSSSRVISLRMNKLQTASNKESLGFITPNDRQSNQLYQLFSLLHMVIDTFESPDPNSTRPISKEMELPDFKRLESTGNGSDIPDVSILQLLSPTCTIGYNSTDQIPVVKSPKSSAAGAASNAGSTAALKQLEQRLQRKAGGGGPAPSSTRTGNATASPGENNDRDRKWAKKGTNNNNHLDFQVKEQLTTQTSITKMEAVNAAKLLSIFSMRSVIHMIWIIFDECPNALDAIVKAGELDQLTVRDSNIDEGMFIGVANFKIVPFLRMALTVLLHALSCNQEAHDLCEIILSADTAVRRFGARLFLLAVEDSLQYWMRIIFFHAASVHTNVRQTVCNFLICLLRSCHLYFGNFTLVSNTILAIINDVQYDILDGERLNILTANDVDKVLSRLADSISSIKTVAVEKIERSVHSQRRFPFCSSLVTFMNNLEIILLASSDLRKYLSHPVPYDYYGGNMLDGPFDIRTGLILQSTRSRRKAVKAEGNSIEIGSSTSNNQKSGFHIEEIMMHFMQAAEVYDPMQLPRFRMQWLENLARLHDLRQNRAEGGEVRWQIFQLCHQIEGIWPRLWVPRPPLEWQRKGVILDPSTTSNKTSTNNDHNYFNVLTNALDSQMFRPWVDASQYWTHMETALSKVTDRYCEINLVHLAERSSSHLISLYRLTKKTELMVIEYNRMANALKNADRLTTDIAMGTYYRVLYTGDAIPIQLRNKEYIFRTAAHLHVSEFHALVMNHVKSIVAEGVEIKMVKDATIAPNAEAAATANSTANTANILMNSVKLIMNQTSRFHPNTLLADWQRKGQTARNLRHMNNVEDLNQVRSFYYSVPFTLDGTRAQAKRIDEQWLRTTILTVKEPFPYILTRQLVISREVKLVSPIEVTMQDIQDRIESMEDEIEAPIFYSIVVTQAQMNPVGAAAAASAAATSNGNLNNNATTGSTNNLMRLVQGTVLPQVNAGAGEVAKVFLSPSRLSSELMLWQGKLTEAQQLEDLRARSAAMKALYEEKRRNEEATYKLKTTLLTFLQCARLLLQRSKKVLIPDYVAFESSPLVQNAFTPQVISPIGDNIQVKVARNSLVIQTTGNVGTGGGAGGLAAAVNAANRRSVGEPVVGMNNAAIGPLGSNPGLDHNIKWQTEMERGFESLVMAIYPYIDDLPDAAIFAAGKGGSSRRV